MAQPAPEPAHGAQRSRQAPAPRSLDHREPVGGVPGDIRFVPDGGQLGDFLLGLLQRGEEPGALGSPGGLPTAQLRHLALELGDPLFLRAEPQMLLTSSMELGWLARLDPSMQLAFRQ